MDIHMSFSKNTVYVHQFMGAVHFGKVVLLQWVLQDNKNDDDDKTSTDQQRV